MANRVMPSNVIHVRPNPILNVIPIPTPGTHEVYGVLFNNSNPNRITKLLTLTLTLTLAG